MSDVNKFSTFWDIYWLPWKVTNSNSGWFLLNLGISQKHFHDRDQIYSFEMRGWHEVHSSPDVFPPPQHPESQYTVFAAPSPPGHVVTPGAGGDIGIIIVRDIIRDRGGRRSNLYNWQIALEITGAIRTVTYICNMALSWHGDVNVFWAVSGNNSVDADIMKHLQLCRDWITSPQVCAQCTALTWSTSHSQNQTRWKLTTSEEKYHHHHYGCD